MSAELKLLIIGALLGLVTTGITQLISHWLSERRDVKKRLRDEIAEYKKKHESLVLENQEKQQQIIKLRNKAMDQVIYIIVLKNQRRDILLGFDETEQKSRAEILREVLSDFSKEELEMIAKDKKPIPELPGKPKALTG